MITLPPIKISQGEPFAYSARVMGQSWVGYSGQAVFRLRRRSQRTAFSWNGYGYLSQTDPIVTVSVTGDATGLMQFSLTTAQTLLFPSLPRRGSFVTAQGEITMGNGTLQKKYQFDVGVSEALDVVIQPGDGGGVIVPPVILPATNSVAPLLTGTGKIGTVHSVTSGTWANAVSYLYRWTRNGSVISGATLSTYPAVAADDNASLIGQVAGVNIAGTVSAYVSSNPIATTYVAPVASGVIADVAWQQNAAIPALNVSAYFTGSAIVYSYSPIVAGITINASTGIFTGTPTAVTSGTSLTVTATNSGGFATRVFSVQVLSAATPVLSGLTVNGSGHFQYSSTLAGVAYWAVTDTSVAALSGPALEAQATGYDAGTFVAGSGAETDTVTFTSTPAGFRRAHLIVKNAGLYSNVQTYDFTFVVGDTVVPVLSSPTATQTGATTATGTVSTTKTGGTLYRVLTLSATPPSAAQIKLGQNNTGAAAAFASSQAVSATGVQNVTYASLTASTTYYAYYMHEDGSANQSNVAAAASITTSGAGSPELMIDAGFDNAAKWAMGSSFTVSASKMTISAAAAFDYATNFLGDCPLVTAGVPLTMLLDVATVGTVGRLRIYSEELGAGDTYLRTAYFYDTATDGDLTVSTISKSYTPGASTVKVQLYIQVIDAALSTSFNSLSLKVT